MKKTTILIILLCILSMNISAQDTSKHEIYIYGSGALTHLKVSGYSDYFRSSSDFGYSVGGGYMYYIIPQISIKTGLEYASYNATLKGEALSNRYMETDNEGNEFTYRYDLGNYDESVKFRYLHIPLMVQYNLAIKENTSFYVAGGGKVAFHMSTKYENKTSSLTTMASYTQWAPGGVPDFITDIPELGLVESAKYKSKGSVDDFNTLFFVSAETGLKFKLPKKFNLYTGIYFDYSLNKIKMNKVDSHMVAYNVEEPANIQFNSVMRSTNGGEQLIKKLSPLAVGVKVAISFGL